MSKADKELAELNRQWLLKSAECRYSYGFTWLGRPIIQYPQDIQAVQELIWSARPDLIIETGIAHGGSLVLSASVLALLDLDDATRNGQMLDPTTARRKVIGIDIDIRAHNRAAIEAHFLANRIEMLEGSSIDADIVTAVRARAASFERVMVFLDSMHTEDHVLSELDAYAPLVTPGSYCVVFDTVIEDMPAGWFKDRPWDVGNNPKTAVHAFLRQHSEFEIDKAIEEKLWVTVAPDGFLKRLR
ncbi:MAG TPA: cephalosporin hydroxylase family protein [Beijerinckiaceae bacterium]|jgi:cephalosporin hydroxylase|nr:cephalosporin hydroxylase family protein [Beijerinckiaceae bacterium]